MLELKMSDGILFASEVLDRIENGKQSAFRRPLLPRPQEIDGETVWTAPVGRGAYKAIADEVGKLRIDPHYLRFPVGARLWCKEPWAEIGGRIVIKRTAKYLDGEVCINFLPGDREGIVKWNAPTTMTEGMSRLHLEIQHVDVCLLQDVRADQITAEGFSDFDAWKAAWEEKYGGKEGLSWQDNPYTTFCVVRRVSASR